MTYLEIVMLFSSDEELMTACKLIGVACRIDEDGDIELNNRWAIKYKDGTPMRVVAGEPVHNPPHCENLDVEIPI
jgi:hypothetical protein